MRGLRQDYQRVRFNLCVAVTAEVGHPERRGNFVVVGTLQTVVFKAEVFVMTGKPIGRHREAEPWEGVCGCRE